MGQPTTTPEPLTTPGKYRKWERARPNGQSARRYFLLALCRFLGGIATVVGIAVAFNRYTWHARTFESCVVLLGTSSGGECTSDPSLFVAGVWQTGPQLPLLEHYASILEGVATWPPIAVAIALGTVASAILVRYPGLSRFPLSRRRPSRESN